MRRESLVAVLMMAALAACSDAAPGAGQAPAPAKETAAVAGLGDSHPAPSVMSDLVSGCVYGAPLVKVLINLQPKAADHCVAEVTPASVCVTPAGVVRFKIQNGCPPPSGGGGRALEITRPVFKLPLTTRLPTPGPTPTPVPPPLFQSCELRVQPIDKSERRVVWCDVAENAHLGFYKYGLTGQIEHLDPDVEVQPPD